MGRSTSQPATTSPVAARDPTSASTASAAPTVAAVPSATAIPTTDTTAATAFDATVRAVVGERRQHGLWCIDHGSGGRPGTDGQQVVAAGRSGLACHLGFLSGCHGSVLCAMPSPTSPEAIASIRTVGATHALALAASNKANQGLTECEQEQKGPDAQGQVHSTAE